MSDTKRQKASDVFADTKFLFAEKTTDTSRAFPTIQSLKMVVREEDMGNLVAEHHFSLGSLPGEYLNCRNPRCYNGGYHIGQFLRFAEQSRETHVDDSRSCQGYEGSPKGRIRRGPCDHWFRVTADFEFKDPDATAETNKG